MLADGTNYIDLGGDSYTKRDPVPAKQKAIRQLQGVGYDVTIRPAVA